IQTVAERDVAVAPASQRLLSTTQELPAEGDRADAVARQLARLRGYPALRGFTQVGGFAVPGTATNGRRDRRPHSPMADPDDPCAQVRGRGRCGGTAGTALVSSRTAAALGIQPGDPLRLVTAGPKQPLALTVAGVYRPRDPADPYWGSSGLLPSAATGGAAP